MATIANLKLGQSRRLYVSASKEATFGTAATLSHILNGPGDWPRLDVSPTIIKSNEYTSGGATDHPQSHIIQSYGLSGSVSVWASLEALGIFLAKAMNGGDTKAGAGPYTHTLAYASLPGFLEGMTIQENISTATHDATNDRVHTGVAVDSFEFSFGRTGFAMVNAGLIGSGRSAEGSDITEGNLSTPSWFITPHKVRVAIEACGTAHDSPWDGGHEVGGAGAFPTIDPAATAISEYIDSFKFTVANGATDTLYAGQSTTAGTYGSNPYTANRSVTVEFTAFYGDSTKALMRLFGSTATAGEYMIILDIAGDTAGYGAQIVFPLCALTSVPSGGTGMGPQKYTFSFEGRKDVNGLEPISAYIANADTNDYH